MSRAASWAAFASIGLLAVSCASPFSADPGGAVDAGGQSSRPSRVLLVSVDGLRPEHLRPSGLDDAAAPGLARLARAGVVADALGTVGAPLAYPAHANLVTGNAPDRHGVVADHLLGKRGVRNAPFWHATRVQGDSLWQRLREQGRSVAAIGWPSTVGASIDLLVPDLVPVREGETWLGVLEGAAVPELLAAMRRELASPVPAWPAAAERDRALVAAACEAMRAPRDPALVLLRLSELGEQIVARGPDAPEIGAVVRRVDRHIARLLGCGGDRRGLAIAVAGGPYLEAVHTRVDPNAALAEAGLLRRGDGASVASWTALVRATDGAATVHAASEAAALEARRLLDHLARSTGAFRVVTASELQERRGDPQAWFGLEAAPGYVFADGALPPLLRPAGRRAAGSLRGDRGAAFVLSGRGVRGGIRVPGMTQLDVAPTLAQLLGFALEGAEGRVLVGTLAGAAALPPVAATPAARSGSAAREGGR